MTPEENAKLERLRKNAKDRQDRLKLKYYESSEYLINNKGDIAKSIFKIVMTLLGIFVAIIIIIIAIAVSNNKF